MKWNTENVLNAVRTERFTKINVMNVMKRKRKKGVGKMGYEFTSSYRRKEWYSFREKCLSLANRECEICHKSQSEVTLQIHHPHYEKGLLPWEYDEKFCQVLCKGCHAREHGIIKPLDGWCLIHSDWEEGESSGDTFCENCDTAMKWHNDLWHPDWGVITVGYVCAEKLENGEVYNIRKNNLKMRTFLNSPRWKRTPMGWKYNHGNRHVFAFKNENGWKLRINGEWGKLFYNSLESAKERSFKHLLRKHE